MQQLKDFIYRYINSRVPGMYQLVDLLTKMHYHASCIDLLFSSPSKLYLVILSHYRGDVNATDMIFQILFLNPIAMYFRRLNMVHTLLEYAKLGKDKEFLDLIKEYINSES